MHSILQLSSSSSILIYYTRELFMLRSQQRHRKHKHKWHEYERKIVMMLGNTKFIQQRNMFLVINTDYVIWKRWRQFSQVFNVPEN